MSPRNDTAQWIWCEGEEKSRNFYLYARKTLLVPAPILRATAHVTADSRYHLFCNGTSIARGPARCDRHWQCLDEWDITQNLRQGENALAALVHHYGEWTFAYMLGRGGFFAEITAELEDGNTLTWGTDASWRVRPATAWQRNLPRMSIQLGFPEVYDARLEPAGWKEIGFDDSSWQPATVLGPAGMEPWPHFENRDIPAMTEHPLLPGEILETGEAGTATTGHYVDILRVVWNPSHGVAYLATYVWSPGDFHGEIHAGSQEAIRLWVNGNLLVSNCVTRDPAPDQEQCPVHLRAGWNSVLAKIVQGEGQSHFYFRIEGEDPGKLIYSQAPVEKPESADQDSPWSIIAPFDSAGVQQGFETPCPPEQTVDLNATYRGKGRDIRWISAGVTREAALTAVILSRETRFPGKDATFRNTAGLITPGPPAMILPGAEHASYAVIDFGKEVTGYPAVEIDMAEGGEILDMGYAEALYSPGGALLSPALKQKGMVNPDRAGVHYADRYLCRAGNQRFQTFDKRAFRYLQIDVRNVRQPLSIGPVSLVFSTYPVEERGRFASSDESLDRIWEIGAWTVRLNMEDAYTDCPWRERGQWWGDARVQALVNYYAFGDLKLIRRGLRMIGQSQTGEGWTKGMHPSDWSYAILPTFTLLWIISLYDYYLFSGDRELVRELFPVVERAIAAFAPSHSEHGLLNNVPHWLFVDWAPVTTSGESASINALYHGALTATARLAEALGDRHRTDGFDELAGDIRSAINLHLWDPAHGCYRDSMEHGELTQKISEQANCWAIVFDVAGKERTEQIARSLFERDLATVRTGTPYFGFYVLQAMAKAGHYGKMLDYLRARWKGMLDWGATTWWENWEPIGSFCHGWSSGPTVILQSEILGMKPGKPGWDEVLVAPHPCDVMQARGTVPTPHGEISVEWTRNGEFSLLVTTPVPGTVRLPSEHPEIVYLPDNAEQVEIAGEKLYAMRRPGTFRFRSH